MLNEHDQELIMELKVFREDGKIVVSAVGFHPLLESQGNTLPIEDYVSNMEDVPVRLQRMSRSVLVAQKLLTNIGLVEYRNRVANFKKGTYDQ